MWNVDMKMILASAACVFLMSGCIASKHHRQISELSISGTPTAICLRADYKKERVTPEVISISTLTPYGLTPIWTRKFEADRPVTIDADQCIPIDPKKPLPDIQPGIPYHAYAQSRSTADRLFLGYFCVVGEPGGYALHQVERSKKNAQRDWSQCQLKQALPTCVTSKQQGEICQRW